MTAAAAARTWWAAHRRRTGGSANASARGATTSRVTASALLLLAAAMLACTASGFTVTQYQDLRFDADPLGRPEREEQSLHDANGRIVGWFSWAPERSLIRALYGLWLLTGLAAVALAAGGLMTARMSYRLAASLVRSTSANRKLTSEDALTGLPNRRVMFEYLEQALAR